MSREALLFYSQFDDPVAWTRLVRRAMAQDFTWERQVTQYLELYEWMTQR